MRNPYPGINAHLNSLLQTAGTIDQTYSAADQTIIRQIMVQMSSVQ